MAVLVGVGVAVEVFDGVGVGLMQTSGLLYVLLALPLASETMESGRLSDCVA